MVMDFKALDYALTLITHTRSISSGVKNSQKDNIIYDPYEFEERAAIYEYEAGYTREEAERLAFIDMGKIKR